MQCNLGTLLDSFSLPSIRTDHNNLPQLIAITMETIFLHRLQHPVTLEAFIKAIAAYKNATGTLQRLDAYRQLNKLLLPDKVHKVSPYTQVSLLLLISKIGKFFPHVIIKINSSLIFE